MAYFAIEFDLECGGKSRHFVLNVLGIFCDCRQCVFLGLTHPNTFEVDQIGCKGDLIVVFHLNEGSQLDNGKRTLFRLFACLMTNLQFHEIITDK